MHKPRYQVSVALNEDDNKRLRDLQVKGIKITEIFRIGLAEAEKQDKKS